MPYEKDRSALNIFHFRPRCEEIVVHLSAASVTSSLPGQPKENPYEPSDSGTRGTHTLCNR